MQARRKPRRRTEAQEQILLFNWARSTTRLIPELRLLFHIPNGGARDRRTGAGLKAQGLRPGVPDLCLPVARGAFHGLYIELKRSNGSTSDLSAAQKAWIQALNAEGYLAVVAFGADDAKHRIMEYLSDYEPPIPRRPLP